MTIGAAPTRMMGRRAAGLVMMAGLLAWTLAILPKLRITTEITRFLPTHGDNAAQARATVVTKALTQSSAAQQLIIDVSIAQGGDGSRLAASATALAAYLRSLGEVTRVTSGLSPKAQDDIAAFLASLPPWTYVPEEGFSSDGIDARLAQLKDKLAGADAALYAAMAPADPLGSMAEALAGLEELQGGSLVSVDGLLMTSDQAHVFLFVETRASSFDATSQRPFLTKLRKWEQANAPVRLAFGGAAPFAIASETQIKADIERIGAISTLGILLLFLVLFRTPRLLGLALVPLGAGCAAGLLACHYAFGGIHGITLAFGTSLLGVGIDYIEHYYTHFGLAPRADADGAMQGVWKSLVVGGVSTVLGTVGLLFAGIAGFLEMALFAGAAIATSLAVTILLVPAWMPATYHPTAALLALRRAMRSLMLWLLSRQWSRRARAVTLAVSVGVVFAAAVLAQFTENLELLSASRGPHAVEDDLVRTRLAQEDGGVVAAVVPGADPGAQLAEVGGLLDKAQARGLVTGHLRLAPLFPSLAAQRARHAAATASAGLVKAKMGEQGFAVDMFAPYWEALAGGRPPLTFAEFMASPLGAQLTQATGVRGDLVLLPIQGVANIAALQADVGEAAVVFAPAAEVRSIFKSARRHIVGASVLGLVALFGILWLRYRKLTKAVVAMLPAVAATSAVVAVYGVMGVALHILHLLALMLVLAMATDFGVFLVDKTEDVDEAATSLVSMIVAAVTTILSFGLLGFSSNPGLAALGYTVALGVALALMLCPLAMAVFRMPALPGDVDVH